MAKSKNYSGSATLVFLCCLLGIPTATMLLDGIVTDTPEHALIMGALLGFAHILLRPLLRMLSAPIGCLTLGLFGFVIDVALLYGCASFVPGFSILNWWHAFLTAILINSLCAIVGRKN